MSKRKTFKVEELRNNVNAMLKDTDDKYQERRIGAFVELERILHATDNYCGFAYLNSRDMGNSKFGSSVGINIDKIEDENYKEKFNGTDSTRRYYF